MTYFTIRFSFQGEGDLFWLSSFILVLCVRVVLRGSIRGVAMGNHLRAAALAGKATKGEPDAAIVGILREDAAGGEEQVEATRGISQPS